MNVLRQVGHNVRRLRLKRKIPQEVLALDAEIAANYLSGIERGTRNPTMLVLNRLARALKVPLTDLVAPVSGREPLPKNLRRGPDVHRVTRKPRKPPKR